MKNCSNCAWRAAQIGQDNRIAFGLYTCHRFPPQVHLIQTAQGIQQMNVWPGTTKTDLCGEYKADGEEDFQLPGEDKPPQDERPT